MASILSLYRQGFANLQRNIWILSIATFINRAGSMVLLFTSLYLTKDLHFSIAQAGLIMSFYGIGSVAGSYAGGWLTDRINYFDILIFSLLACGVILLLMLFATTPISIALILFFYAFTADMFRPANAVAIAAYSTAENRTRSVTLLRLAINLGFSVGPAVGGLVAFTMGYKWLFVIDAFTGFAAAAMLYFYLPRKPVEKNRHHNSVLKDSSTSAYRDYSYLIFIFLVSLYGICFFQLFASIPQYFSHVCNYNESTIGLLLALNGLVVVIIEMPVVTVLEKRKIIFPFIVIGVLCIPIALAFLWLGKQLMIAAIIYTIIITISEIFAMPFMMNYSISRPPHQRQGQYSALYSIAYGIANIAAPSLGLGIAAKYGFDKMFIFFIFLSLVTALGFSLLNKNQNKWFAKINSV